MRFRHLGAALTVSLLVACAGGERLTGPSSHTADLAFILLGPPGNVIATITVEVTGPGLDSALTFNFPIVSGSATGTARVPAGAGRRLVARAFDAAGVVTHRGDTTVTVVEGTNTSVTLSLQPLIGGQPLTLSFGTNAVAVNRRDTTMTLGDTVRFAAAAVNWRGVAVPADSIVWASSNPAVATVSASGLVTAQAAGTTAIAAAYDGATARRLLTVASIQAPGGLVAYFPFNGDAVDASGNGHSGTVFGASLAPDRFGVANRAYWFDGSYIESDVYNFTGAFTLAAWVRPEAHADSTITGSIVGKFTPPGNVDMNINSVTGSVILHTSSTAAAFSPDRLLANQWYFLAATYDGTSTARIYVNGVLVVTQTGMGSPPSTAVALRIGQAAYGGGSFKGTIDEVRVYSAALSNAAIAYLHALP